MEQVLGGFQDQVTRILMGRFLRWRLDRKWEYTSVDSARSETWFDPIETYNRRRQNTVAQYIATRLFLTSARWWRGSRGNG